MNTDQDPAQSEVGIASDFMIRVFGSTSFEDHGVPVSIGGKRQQKLLALLAARTGQVVALDWLAEHLWDDDERPDPAQPPIRTYMSRLRSALPNGASEWIETETGGYRLTAPAGSVDYLRFTELRAQAARARSINDPRTARRALDEALDLWRGDPFRELEDCAWVQPDIERLRQDRLEMLEERWETALALGRHTQITGELSAFVAEHGLRDRAVRQYALALHRSSRTAEALQVIDAHRRDLADQSGLDPSREMLELENSLFADDPALGAVALGRPLRGYRLLEEVGSGAFSIVWRGVQPSVDRDVAIKEIRAELATQPDFIRRFEAEAHLVARIEHPHVVPLIDFWRDPDSAYLVMRWLGGGTLERRLDDGRLSVDDTVLLAWQVGGALSAAHAQGVVHRDVKTANVMFDEQGHAFLTDFGIALSTEESGGPEAALSQGTPSYASPEQTRREPLGPPADIFSLAVVLYECLTGSLPESMAGPGGAAAIEETLRPPSAIELRPDVPQAMSDAVAKAMAFDPAQRFETVADFVAALSAGDGRSGRVASSADVGSDLVGSDDGNGDDVVFSGELENPYVGLHAFDGGDSGRFFGRERLVNELVDRLSGDTVASRCVILVGPSGSGKSSVVRAGLVPAIRNGDVPGSAAWFTTTMVPGTNVYESLEAALLRIAVNPPTSLVNQLKDGKRGILRSLRRCLGSDDDRVVVVIDQFEELFIGPSRSDADEFLDALAVAVEDPSSPLRLIVTVRADYYDRPLRHPAFATIVKASAVDVTPLAGDELERAIVEPARQIGVEFEGGVVARLATECVRQPAPLPLLQYTLSELFDQRVGRMLTLASYEDIGGLSGALASRAEALYTSADQTRQTAVRQVFGRLTDPGEASADLRRRASVADFGDDPATAWVVEQYGAARLLTFDRDVGSREPTIEVAHEALLREWPRLVTWLEEDIELLRSVDAIASAANQWNTGRQAEADLYRGPRLENAIDVATSSPGRLRPIDGSFIEASRVVADRQRRTDASRLRRARRLAAGIAVALVVALFAGGLAVRQSSRADDEAERARGAATQADEQRLAAEDAAGRAQAAAADAAAQAEIADAQTDVALEATQQAELATLISRSAAQQGQDPELSLLLALEAHRRAPQAETEQAVLSALGSTALGSRLTTNRPLVDQAGPCPQVTTATNGSRDFAVDDGRLVSRDLITGIVTDHGPSPAPCVLWHGDQEADRRVAVSADGTRLWLGPFAGPWEVDREFSEPLFFVSKQFLATGNLVFRAALTTVQGSPDPAVMLIDDTTGEQVGPVISAGLGFNTATESSDGSLIAVSFGTNPGPEDAGTTIVVDGNTGEEVSRITTALPVRASAVDDQRQELIVGFAQNASILTVDLATGAVVAEVETTARGGLVQGGLGLAPNGDLIAVSTSQIERLDRSGGTTSAPISVQGVAFARIRPDGTTLTGTVDEQISIFDLDSNSLVERSWAAEPGSSVEIQDGVAAVVADGGGDPETIDLASGQRRIYELVSPDGERFEPLGAFYTEAGLWTVDPQMGLLRRWQGGEQQQVLIVEGAPVTGKQQGDLWAVYADAASGYGTAVLVDLGADPPRLAMRVPASQLAALHPRSDGGMYVLDRRGNLRIYDASGARTQEIAIPEADLTTNRIALNVILGTPMAADPATDMIAIVGNKGTVIMVNPVWGTTEVIPGINAVHFVQFVRDGELLVIVESDGSVVLWDVARKELAGKVWQGTGAGLSGAIVWYDELGESMWVATSGKIIEIPTNPQHWVERACQVVGRDFTQDEWDRLVPGDDPLTSACT